MNITGTRIAGIFAAGLAAAAFTGLVGIPAVADAVAPESTQAVQSVSESEQVDFLRAVYGDVSVVCVDAPGPWCVAGYMDASGALHLMENHADSLVVRELVDRPVRELKATGWTADPTDGCECLYPPH